MVALAMPQCNGLLVHLDGQRTALHQNFIVRFPVVGLVFGFAPQTLSAAALQDHQGADSSAI